MTALVRKAGSSTEPGEITLDAQVISGAKTFNAAMTMGASVSTSISGVAHIVNGAFNAGATSTAGGGKRLGFNVNNGIPQAWLTPRNSASSTLGGVAMFLIANTVDTSQAFQIYTNLAADNDAAVGAQIASATQRGTWIFGRDDTTNQSTVYSHAFLSGGRTQLDIYSTGNAAGTGGAAILRLRATGEAGAQFGWYRGTNGGTYDTNSTIKWNWIHGGNAALMTGGGVDAIGFYNYGVNNYMGQLCFDGRWILGPEAGLGTAAGAYHTVYGSIRGQAGTSFRSVLTASLESYICANLYRDGSGATKAITTSGMSYLGVYSQTVSSNTAFEFAANTTSQTADVGISGTTKVILSGTAAGVWTAGDTTNASFPGNNIVGKKDGVAVAAGFVGEKISVYNQTATHYGATATGAGTLVTTSGLGILQTSSTVPIKITLTPGTWQIKAKCEVTQASKVSTSTGITLFQFSISTNTTATSASGGFERHSTRAIVGDASLGTNFDMITSVIINSSATSTDYFLVQNTQGSATGMIINNVCMEAVRIA